MKSILDAKKFTIAENSTYAPEFHCPNPRGWYHSVANIADTPEGLVAVYRLSDSHTAVYTYIMVVFDYTADSGYSSWTQRKDGSIVIVDYTNDSFGWAGALAPQPLLRAYVVEEEDLC